MTRRPPRSPLFPSTALFRSLEDEIATVLLEVELWQCEAAKELEIRLLEHPLAVLVRPAKVMEICVGEAKAARLFEFSAKLIKVNGIGDSDCLRPVLKRVLHPNVGVVQKYELPHGELVEVGVKQRTDDRLHVILLSISIGELESSELPREVVIRREQELDLGGLRGADAHLDDFAEACRIHDAVDLPPAGWILGAKNDLGSKRQVSAVLPSSWLSNVRADSNEHFRSDGNRICTHGCGIRCRACCG